MPRFRHIHNSFRGGEISPSAHGLTNSEIYQQSVDTLTNYIVKPEGGVFNRPGSELVIATQEFYNIRTGLGVGGSTLTGAYRIFPFVASQEESYAVIIKANGTSSAISIINLDSLAQCSYDKGSSFVSTFDLLYLDSLWPNTIDMNEIQYAQTGDILVLTHPSAAPFVLKRTGANAFARDLFYLNDSRINEGYNHFGFPYLPLNTNYNHTLVITGGSGNTLTSNINFFTSDHVGSVFKLTGDNGSGTTVTNTFLVTGYTDAQNVTGTSGNVDFASGPFPIPGGATTPTTLWEESAFSFERGWPRTVSFHEQRVYYGGTEYLPDTIWGSQLGDVFELDAVGVATASGYGTVDSADPFSFIAASNEANTVNYLSSGRSLTFGTKGREYIGTGTQGAFSATDYNVVTQTSYGAQYRQPVRNDSSMIFIERSGKFVREFMFNESEQAYKAQNLSRIADHIVTKGYAERATITGKGLACLAQQNSGAGVLWAIDKNGLLLGLTRDPYLNVTAWHNHRLGGDLNNETPFVHSIAVIPSADGTEDELWLAVERTIDGADVTYIERIRQPYDLSTPQNSSSDIADKMVYCDSAKLKYNASPFTVVDGLDHLEGESVVCVADGDYKGTFTVASGQITLPEAVNDAVVGLSYTSELKTLPHDVGSRLQTSQVAIKRFDRIGIRFNKSIGCKFGSDELGTLDSMDFYDPTIPAEDPVPLFTGDKVEDIGDTYDRRGQIIVQQTLPLPQEICSIVLRGILYD